MSEAQAGGRPATGARLAMGPTASAFTRPSMGARITEEAMNRLFVHSHRSRRLTRWLYIAHRWFMRRSYRE